MASTQYYVGLISGTSVDGVDCVLVEFHGQQPRLLESHFEPTPTELRQKILQACSGDPLDLVNLGQVDIQIGHFFASAVNILLAKTSLAPKDIAAIGSHGQTVWHQPTGEFPFSLQLGDGNSIAYLTGVTTVADFRRMDVAAGGQGAPLAPLLHRNLFHSSDSDRAVVNIGGISNITCLPASGNCLAFDTGPGNVLMDYWIGKHQQKRYDSNGDWASTGNSQQTLLSRLLEEPYLQLPYPKSTGRELFNGEWLEAILNGFESLAPEDVQATLLEFTALTIVSELTKLMQPSALYVCGGGAQNTALMTALKSKLENCEVSSTENLGLHPDWVEAVAFAWMAKQRIEGSTIDTSAFTGASKPVLLGGVYSVS